MSGRLIMLAIFIPFAGIWSYGSYLAWLRPNEFIDKLHKWRSPMLKWFPETDVLLIIRTVFGLGLVILLVELMNILFGKY